MSIYFYGKNHSQSSPLEQPLSLNSLIQQNINDMYLMMYMLVYLIYLVYLMYLMIYIYIYIYIYIMIY